MDAITWPQLIVLMCFGDGTEDAVSGEIHVRSVVQVSDDDDSDTTEHPRLGRVRIDESRSRVHRRDGLVRRERPDGTPMMITGVDTYWIWLDDDDVPTAFPRASASWGSADAVLVERPSASRWEGTDFTRLTGPIEATEYLGRPAWAFELAPPPHKPYPLQLVVDAATGLVLRQANAGFDSVWEWTSIATGVDLPDELFVWDGPAKPSRDHDQEAAQGRAWLADQGVHAPVIAMPTELFPHEWTDDGSFRASLSSHLYGTLARRPLSDEPWSCADELHYPHSYRWSTGAWEWLLGTQVELSDEQFAEVRRQLG